MHIHIRENLGMTYRQSLRHDENDLGQIDD